MESADAAGDAAPQSWATQQLSEFLAGLSADDDEHEATVGAVGRVAEALGADGVALIGAAGIDAATGFGEQVPAAELLAVAAGEAGAIAIPGLGECPAVAAPIEDEAIAALVVARREPAGFTSQERTLIDGMARVLALTVRLIRVAGDERRLRERSERHRAERERLLATLSERQRLLERLSRIQSSIISRRELGEVLDAIVKGAKDLLGDETAGLRLVDPDDPEQMIMVASAGVRPEIVRDNHRSPVGMGAGGRAFAERAQIVIEDYAHSERALPAFAADGIRAALATPVREHGEVVGSLVVATRKAGRRYSRAEREMLDLFAEHASLALTDARTVEDAIHQAFHDSLTGLPNRLLLMDRLEHALARSARSQSRTAVLFVDLDAFKTVNDSLGHAAGDELLGSAARRLVSCVRPGDTAARFGGDEFVVLLEDVDEEAVAAVAKRIIDSLEEPFVVAGREVFLSASIGIALGDEVADDLLRNADLALYRAKGKGKGRHEVFEPQMHAAMVERLELEGALARAMRQQELLLHFQPVFQLKAGRLEAFEALVRWRHPDRGLLGPDEFIPIAEDSRLMKPLGGWVLHTACAQLAAWRREWPELPELRLGINISIAQLDDGKLRDEVAEVVRETGLAPRQLVLELTETAFMDDPEVVAERLRELKGLGVRLAIDDFGTGNASLRHLARFPIDALKIDRSFVAEIVSDPLQLAIARSIATLGESLGLEVTAEGIETGEQLRALVELGCRHGQGFHFARPAEARAMEPLLEQAAQHGGGGRVVPLRPSSRIRG